MRRGTARTLLLELHRRSLWGALALAGAWGLLSPGSGRTWPWLLAWLGFAAAGWSLRRRQPELAAGLELLGPLALLAVGSLGGGLGQLENTVLALLSTGAATALWGLRGLGLGLGLGLLGSAGPERLALGLAGAAGLGLGVRGLLGRLEGERRTLEEALLTDPLTGLGNARALEADFEWYGALAKRRRIPLLLTRWEAGEAAEDDLLAFAQVLKSSVRQEDSLYRSGQGEYVGLHLGLEDERPLVLRVRRKFAQAAVGCTVVEGQPLGVAIAKADLHLAQSGERGGARGHWEHTA